MSEAMCSSSLFYEDTTGNIDDRDESIDSEDDEIDFDNIGLLPTELKVDEKVEKKPETKKFAENDIDLDEFEAEMGWSGGKKKESKESSAQKLMDTDKLMKKIDPLKKILMKSAIVPGFETLETVPRYDVSRRQQLAQSKRERARTKGKKWFNLPATEMTPEIKHDLQVIQMRSVLDPKHFYKKNDMKSLPKYFQIGKVIDSPIDYYNGRLTKKEKKKTIVDELMADAEFAKYNKRKYRDIINSNRHSHSKAHKHARKLKGKKK